MVAAGALYLAFRGVNLREVVKILLGVKVWITAAAIAFYFVSQLIFVARWYMLLRVQGIDIGYWPAVRLHLLGLLYNNYLPSSVGGDSLRAWYVTKHTEKKLEAALSVLVDRAVGLFGLVLMAIVGYWFIPLESRQQLTKSYMEIKLVRQLAEYEWFFLWATAIITAVMVLLISTSKGRTFVYRATKKISHRGADLLGKVYAAMRIYYGKKLALFWAVLLTFACQGMFIVGLWFIGKGMHIQADMKYYFVFFPISWVIGMLPISLGGLGVVEGPIMIMFSLVGVPKDPASALAWAQRFLWLIGSLPGVVIHLMGAHLPKDFSIEFKDRTTNEHE